MLSALIERVVKDLQVASTPDHNHLQSLFDLTKSEHFRASLSFYLMEWCNLLMEEMTKYMQNGNIQAFESHELLMHLRILRNACATKENQNILRSTDIINKTMVPFLLHFSQEKDTNEKYWLCMRTGVQLIGNFITNNEENQDYFWNAHAPSCSNFLLDMLMLSEADRTLLANIAALVFNIVNKDAAKRGQLVDNEAGINVIKLLIHRTVINNCVAEDQAFDWIYFIILGLFQDEVFHILWNALSAEDNEKLHKPTSEEQVLLLKLYDAVIQKVSNKSEDSDLTIESIANEESVLLMAKELTALVEYGSSTQVIIHPETLYSNDVQCIFLFLQILDAVIETEQHLRPLLVTHGFLKVVISLLRQAWETEQLEKTQKAKIDLKADQSPTFGFKRDLVKIIGNLVYRNVEAQNQLYEAGGVELLLNHCKIDNQNPYIKEWTILALRNACENNPNVQSVIEALKSQGVSETPEELKDMGLSLELKGGKLVIKKEEDKK